MFQTLPPKYLKLGMKNGAGRIMAGLNNLFHHIDVIGDSGKL
jgi:hypothetical protein